MHVFTVTHPCDLPSAAILAEQVRRAHPDWPMTVLLLADLADGESMMPPGVALVTPDDLAIQAPTLTVVLDHEALPKAFVGPMAQVLLEEHERILYLEPTLALAASLEPLAAALDQGAVALVPYLPGPGPADAPPRDDRLTPPGIFHPGVLAFRRSAQTQEILAEWPQRALALRDEPPPGVRLRMFDRWLDGLAARADQSVVLRRPNFVFGAWNVEADRNVEGGPPPALVDFGEFDPADPHLLSAKHDVGLGPFPNLAALARERADTLLRLRRSGGTADDPYARLPDGTPLDLRLRRLAGAAIDEGALTDPPFSAAGLKQFYDWLNEPAQRGAAAQLTRYHEAIWEDRIDLRSAYPHIDGPDAEGLAGWMWRYGPEQHPMPRALLPAREPEHVRERASLETDPLWGVNVAGFFRSELGLGEAARLLIAGLDAAHVPALPIQGALIPPCRQGAEFVFAGPADAPFPINIICMNGDTIPVFAREAGEEFFAGRHTIALWWWELGEIPADWQEAFEYVDEVWVASDLIRDAVSAAAPVPVIKVPLPVTVPEIARHTRSELGLPDGFTFLFMYDYHSTAARKNPVGVVEAFRRAFPPGSGASLVLKTINAENLPAEHERVVTAAAGHPDIHFINGYVSAAAKDALIDACDCYVSLHRSEGLGLTPAEAMYLGKPVIATGYGGVLEFMTPENSYLVDHGFTTVGRRAHPYPPDGIWAEPDLDQAAEFMRAVVEHPEEARRRGRRAAADIRRTHAPAVAGAAMTRRLRAVHERLTRAGAHSLVIAHLPEPDERDGVIPAAGAPGRNPVVRATRRVTSRVARPQMEHLRDVLSGEIDHKLRRVGTELERHHMAGRAETLAGFRREQWRLRDLERRIEDLDRTVRTHLARHSAAPYMAPDSAFTSWREDGVGMVLGYRDGVESHAGYLGFTDAFRGPEEHVRELQRPYLPLLREHAPVLDVGCGRGEMLDLLLEAGVPARGLDLDDRMVEHCAAKGLDVTLGDAVDGLRSVDDGTLGTVFAAQVVEHLPATVLSAFLSLALEKLRPEGILVAETVNPYALEALHAFWVDPTHHHPLFPETLLELCRIAGFGQAYVMHPGGRGDALRDRDEAPAYAVVARRAG